MFACLFSVLTLTWILIDALTLSWPLWGLLAVARLVAAGAFLILAQHRFETGTANSAYLAIGALFGIAACLCLSATLVLYWFRYDEISLFAGNTYLYAPFLIAAGLGVFPLTAAECAVLALPVIVAMVPAAFLWHEFMTSVSITGTLWRLGVMATIGSLAAMNQLNFLIELTEQTARDALTGVWNRKSGEELICLQFALAARRGAPFSILFVDLDWFKRVNDRFGHMAGDTLLHHAARSLQQSARRQDIVVRWGGEEFVVVLPDTDCSGAERIALRVAQAGLGSRPDGFAQTASIGIAERTEDKATNWAALVELADTRMYAAKQAGRNRYVAPNGRVAKLFYDIGNDTADAYGITPWHTAPEMAVALIPSTVPITGGS